MTPLAWLVDLVVASLSFLNVWCRPHSQICLFPMRSVCGTFQFRKTRCAVAILSMMNRRQPLRQKKTKRFVSGEKNFLSKRNVQSFEFTPTFGHPQKSTLAKMITDAGESEEMVKCATRYPCSLCKPDSSPASCVSRKNPTLCWLMCISGITKPVRCWCTRWLMRRQVFTTLKSCHHNQLVTCMKRS